MIDEVARVWQDEALLADELKIIAGEQNGLKQKDRESLRNSALIIEEMMKFYGRAAAQLSTSEAARLAVSERLREANAALAKSNVFPTLSASGHVVGWTSHD